MTPMPTLSCSAAAPQLPLPAQLGRSRHWEVLLASITAIVLSFSFRIVEGDRVAWWFLPRWPLPHTCPARAWFGVACPACGLTRSFICLAQGRWAEAWHQHHLGWLFALAVLLQLPYRAYRLHGGRALPRRWGKAIWHGLLALLVINWLLGFVT